MSIPPGSSPDGKRSVLLSLFGRKGSLGGPPATDGRAAALQGEGAARKEN